MKVLRGVAGFVACGLLGTAPAQADVVADWNAIALACTQAPPPLPHRPGPPSLLDIALVQAAVHDAVQAIEGDFEAYAYANPALLGVGSPEAAVAAASYQVLVGIFGAADPCLAAVADPAVTYAGDPGLQAGNEAAAALLPLYRPTFALPTDPFLGGSEPGDWRPTPPAFSPGANTFMAVTPPFAMLRPSQFRPPPPPPLKSKRYLRDYNEVKQIGALGSTTRTAEQTDLARFWSVNFIAQWFATLRQITVAQQLEIGDAARLLALASLVAADSQISGYDAKYHYNFWRPLTAIREGNNDGNRRTVGDPNWESFLANPPYPDHHSGANTLTGGITRTLQLFFGTDRLEFSVSSSAAGLVTNPRLYSRISAAAEEVVEVRILQGIHFRTADGLGRLHGERIAHWTFMRFLRPIPPRRQ